MPPFDPSRVPPSVPTTHPSFGALLRAAAHCWFRSLTVAALFGMAAGYAVWTFSSFRYNADLRLRVQRAPAGIVEKDIDAAAELRAQVEIINNPIVFQFAVEEPELADLVAERGWSSPSDRIAAAVQVDVHPKDSAVRIRASDKTSAGAVVIAHSTANAYLRELQNRRERYLHDLQETLAHDSSAIVKEEPVPVPAPRGDDPRLGVAERELVQVRSDYQNAVDELAALRTAEQKRTVPVVSEDLVNETFLNDAFVQQMKTELKPIEEVIQRTIRIAVLGEKEPALRGYLDRRAAINKELEERRTAIRKTLAQLTRDNSTTPNLQPQIKTIQERVVSLTGQQEKLEKEIRSLRAAACDSRRSAAARCSSRSAVGQPELAETRGRNPPDRSGESGTLLGHQGGRASGGGRGQRPEPTTRRGTERSWGRPDRLAFCGVRGVAPAARHLGPRRRPRTGDAGAGRPAELEGDGEDSRGTGADWRSRGHCLQSDPGVGAGQSVCDRGDWSGRWRRQVRTRGPSRRGPGPILAQNGPDRRRSG